MHITMTPQGSSQISITTYHLYIEYLESFPIYVLFNLFLIHCTLY
jgi:hypothetical protein